MTDERTGVIVDLNIHDYVSDIDGTVWDGCLAILNTGEGNSTILYTKSLRLQAALVTSFLGKGRVTVSYRDTARFAAARDREVISGPHFVKGSAEGPFTVKAVWTMPPK
jgi:hypothetical protein